jgi:hypothetical protein
MYQTWKIAQRRFSSETTPRVTQSVLPEMECANSTGHCVHVGRQTLGQIESDAKRAI